MSYMIQFITLAIVLGFIGCSFAPKKNPPAPANPQQTKEYERGKKLIEKKKTSKGLKELESFAAKNPGSELTDDAFMLIGRTAYDEKDYDRSYRAYIAIVNSKVFSPIESQAAYMAAKSLTMLSRFDEALSLVGRIQSSSKLNEAESLNVEKLRFYLLSQLGDHKEGLISLVKLHEMESNPQKKKAFKFKAIDYVETKLTSEQLEEVSNSSKYGFASAYSNYRLGLFYFEQSDFSNARSSFDEVIDSLPNTELAEKAQNYINQIKAREYVSPRTIGVVLPLTKKHSAVAQRTLKGLQLGLGIYGPTKSNFRLAVIDSQANPDAARRAVERLVMEDNAIAIVGSLLSKTASAVAAKSEELGVPNITLSQKSGLTNIGEHVFRNALTREMQVRSLVKTAMDRRRMKRFAILYPNDSYGVEFANLFWDEVLANGGEITAVQSYSPDEADFSGPIRRMVGTFYVSDRIKEYKGLLRDWYKKQKYISSRTLPPEDLLPPALDFDAIFIPDGARAVGQIAPMLAYNEVKNATLLGTNIWNTKELVTRGQQYVENSSFVDGILTSTNQFKASQFYREYKDTFKQSPSIFEAQAYDIGLLLRQLIIEGARSREKLAGKLKEVNGFNGSIGKMTVNSKRELERPIFNLIIRNGSIMQLSDNILADIEKEAKVQ